MEIAVSLIFSVVLSFILGIEREITNKNAGLRTHILVCLGACVFTIVSIYGFPTVVSGDNPNGIRDTARVAAQIVTGIGFIGAGTVLRHGSSVFGLTTAATLWMAASIGMACGAEQYELAIFATLLSVFVLVLIKFFERKLLSDKKIISKILQVKLECSQGILEELQDDITSTFKNIIEIKRLENTDDNAKIVAVINFSDRNPIKTMYKHFQKFKNLKSISIQEANER